MVEKTHGAWLWEEEQEGKGMRKGIPGEDRYSMLSLTPRRRSYMYIYVVVSSQYSRTYSAV
jgi:hypothetical protein